MSTPTPPAVSALETVPPSFPSVVRLGGYPDKASVILEEQSYSDLVDEGEEQSTSGWAKALFHKRMSPYRDPDATATRRSVFDDPHLAPFYWPKRDYENMHRFDPSARWTYREEKALLRKIDWRVMIIAAVSFSAVSFGSNSIERANSDNFLPDLHLTTDDFNLGNAIFRLSFLCAELPSQLISKRIGPDRWIPIQICVWSVASLSQIWVTGKPSFLACRALLGLLQGGFAPELILYMSYFYTKTELPIRFAILLMSMTVYSILASLMTYGIFHLNGVAGMAGWQWLFLIQGLITFAIGVISSFNMPPSPTQTKTWFRPKGWLTEREEVIIVNKILRDDPTKGDMHNREGLSLKRTWTSICNYDLWPMYIFGLLSTIPSGPPSTYLTLSLRDAGFNTFNTNLLTIPSQIIGIINTFFIALVSESVGERTLVSMVAELWILPFLVALYALPSKPSPWLLFGLTTGLLSYPHTGPIHVGWTSRNSRAVASRTVTMTLYSIFLQASTVVASQIYVASDAPRYQRGNKILIVICSVNILLLYPGTKVYYMWRNRQRAKIWDAMTAKEKAHYLKTTNDVGNRRLDFRFAH